MGRNRVVIDDEYVIIYGFDNIPMGGYFAELYSISKGADSDPVDQVGFYPGVSKNKIIDFFEKHNALEAAKKQTKEAFNNLILDLPC